MHANTENVGIFCVENASAEPGHDPEDSLVSNVYFISIGKGVGKVVAPAGCRCTPVRRVGDTGMSWRPRQPVSGTVLGFWVSSREIGLVLKSYIC